MPRAGVVRLYAQLRRELVLEMRDVYHIELEAALYRLFRAGEIIYLRGGDRRRHRLPALQGLYLGVGEAEGVYLCRAAVIGRCAGRAARMDEGHVDMMSVAVRVDVVAVVDDLQEVLERLDISLPDLPCLEREAPAEGPPPGIKTRRPGGRPKCKTGAAP